MAGSLSPATVSYTHLLHLALDREEELARLCPACRREAAEERCPACGALRTETAAGQNAAFDEARFERLKRGESG